MFAKIRKKKLHILAGTLAYGLSVITYFAFFNQEMSTETKKRVEAATHNAILFVRGANCPVGFTAYDYNDRYLRVVQSNGIDAVGANTITGVGGVTDATSSSDGAHTHSSAGAHTHSMGTREVDKNQDGGTSSATQNQTTGSAGAHTHGSAGAHTHTITIRSIGLKACKWAMH